MIQKIEIHPNDIHGNRDVCVTHYDDGTTDRVVGRDLSLTFFQPTRKMVAEDGRWTLQSASEPATLTVRMKVRNPPAVGEPEDDH